jgi:hypothetical protein
MEWFKNIFAKPKQQSEEPIRVKFEKVIIKWLEVRDDCKTGYWSSDSPENGRFPRYVMDMMKELKDIIPGVELKDIMVLEIISMGYTDYVRKFSIRLEELYHEKIIKNGNS